MLATSRERLNLAGEQVYPLAQLRLRSDAVDPGATPRLLPVLELNRAGLEASWKSGKPVRVAWSLGELAGAELGLDRPERAARLLGAADAALDRMGAGWQPLDQPEHDHTLARLEATSGGTASTRSSTRAP